MLTLLFYHRRTLLGVRAKQKWWIKCRTSEQPFLSSLVVPVLELVQRNFTEPLLRVESNPTPTLLYVCLCTCCRYKALCVCVCVCVFVCKRDKEGVSGCVISNPCRCNYRFISEIPAQAWDFSQDTQLVCSCGTRISVVTLSETHRS